MSERKTISEYPIKPRRTRGTYTNKIRNRVAAGVLAVCSLIGTAYAFLPSSRKISHYVEQNFMTQSEEYKTKKARLAPFSLDPNLEESHNNPVLIDPATPRSVKAGMSYNDPLRVSPQQ